MCTEDYSQRLSTSRLGQLLWHFLRGLAWKKPGIISEYCHRVCDLTNDNIGGKPDNGTIRKPCLSIEINTNPKNRKTRCATVPHRVPIISRNVCAFGAFNLSFAASCGYAHQHEIWHKWLRMPLGRFMRTCAKSRTCTVAPAPYHHGPEMPYLYAEKEEKGQLSERLRKAGDTPTALD